ncbi:MAG: hypothetical protein ACKOQP_00210, partial [Bacteroidota bacterium]
MSIPQKYLFFCQDVPYLLRKHRAHDAVCSLENLWEEIQEKLHPSLLHPTSPETSLGQSAVLERAVEDPQEMWGALRQR